MKLFIPSIILLSSMNIFSQTNLNEKEPRDENAVAQAEYAQIMHAIDESALREGEVDHRRVAIDLVLQKFQEDEAIAALIASYRENPNPSRDHMRNFTATIGAAFDSLEEQANALTCQWRTVVSEYDGETWEDSVCETEDMRTPAQGRGARYAISFGTEAFFGNRLHLSVCDKIEIPRLFSEDEEAFGEPSVMQCLEYDLRTSEFRLVNKIYMSVAGLFDGCFGTPYTELTDFQSYFSHRMRAFVDEDSEYEVIGGSDSDEDYEYEVIGGSDFDETSF